MAHGKKNPTISLCMIVRNEEECIERCIESARRAVDEIIIVDTGSEDRTVEIARRLGARVFHHRWNDDFSEARNYSLEQASGDWILVLDADETLAANDICKVCDLAGGDADGYTFTYRSYSRQTSDIRWVANDGSYREGDGWDGWISGKVVRLFKRDQRIRFSGFVHESVDPSIAAFGGIITPADTIIHHFHELKGKEKFRDKQLQYLRLCEKGLEKFPGTPKTYFDMGLICRHLLGDIPKAISYQKKAIQLDPHFEDARVELAISQNLTGDSRGAAAEITTLLEHNPDYAPALLLCGIMLERRGKVERAIECYEHVIRLNANLIDARLSLGALVFKEGDIERARNEWNRAHEISPSNARALLNLGALELHCGNHDAAQCFLQEALELAPDDGLLWNNFGALHASQGRLQEALEAFEKAVELAPSYGDARRNLEAIRNRMNVAV
jgi:glycosyltransferase involved in cell wall biosynthesis/predicted TPR repeat methyltransferase